LTPPGRIDTQDVLLEQQKTERLIEIGPSDTLTVMAKRTIKSQYEGKDTILSTRRQLLSGDADLSEIYYEVAPQPEVIPSTSSQSAPPPPYTPTPSERTEVARQVAAPISGSTSKKTDLPITAVEIIVSIVAQKLKKSSQEISTSSTIKSLVSGMSARIVIHPSR